MDDRTAEKLTPEERRTLLRALADRMLLKAASLGDPEDMAGVEKTVRVTAGIERIYYRCDRAERHTPDPRKVEAERATHESAAIKARVALATDLEWGEMRRSQLGKWWDAAETTVQTQSPAPVPTPAVRHPEAPFVYRYDDDGVDDTATQAPGDSEIGPVLDSLLDDMDALNEALAAGKTHTPSRDYPPVKTAPFSSSDDECYAVTKAMYDNLRIFHDLKTAGASP